MKQERAQRTREQVLDAAAEVFAARGFAQATLESVVSRTGMSKGALYGHFRSKEDLARALITHADRTWEELLVRTERAGSPLAALRLLTVGLAERLRLDQRIRAALRLASELPQGEDHPGAALGRIPGRMASLAAQGQADGAISPAYAPAAVAQLLLSSVLGGQALALLPGAQMPCGIDELWHLLEAAIRSADGTPRAARAGRPPDRTGAVRRPAGGLTGP